MRLALRARVHWLRLLLTHALLTFGGGSLVALLLGRPAPWATADGGGAIPALLCAHVLFFHARMISDVPARLYRVRALRDGWQFIASIQIALGVAAGAEAGAAAGLPAPTRVLLAILAANGGAILAETTDVLLQGHARYAQPIHGPGPGTVLAVWAAVVYACVLRRSGSGTGSGSSDALVSAQTARAIVLLGVAAANFWIPGRALSAGSTAAMETALPGFAGVWDPELDFQGQCGEGREEELHELDMNPPPWPVDAGLFGYHVETLREIGMRARAVEPPVTLDHHHPAQAASAAGVKKNNATAAAQPPPPSSSSSSKRSKSRTPREKR
jgi:hypothetical protein